MSTVQMGSVQGPGAGAENPGPPYEAPPLPGG